VSLRPAFLPSIDSFCYEYCATSQGPLDWFEVQPIAFGVSFNHNLCCQSPWSLFNGTWQKRPRELDRRLRFENEEMTLHMQ